MVSLGSVYSVDPDITRVGYDTGIRALECFLVKFQLGKIIDNFVAALYSWHSTASCRISTC